MYASMVDMKEMKLTVTATSFFVFLLMRQQAAWGGFLIVPLHLCSAACSTCSETTNRFPSPWAGLIVPIHVDRHSVWHVHHLPQRPGSLVLSYGTQEKPQVLWMTHPELSCSTKQQGKLQVRGCSTDRAVKWLKLLPSHILSTPTVTLVCY